MNILFIIKPENFPSARIRIKNLLPILIKNKIKPFVEVIPSKPRQKRSLFASASKFHLVVLQKELLPVKDIAFLRKNSKKLIFDFDDAIYYKPVFSKNNIEAEYCPKTRERFNAVINTADKVIVANQKLHEKTRMINQQVPIEIIPSAVETDVEVKDNYELRSPPVIGWVGLGSNLPFLVNFNSAFLKLNREIKFNLRIIADFSVDIPGIDVEFIKWDLKTQYKEITGFDVGIMPLTSTPCTEGKSAYKLLQYMTAGVPAVASAVGVNKKIGAEDKYCLLADDIEMFTEKLKLLLNDITIRKKLGKNGRKLIEENYSIEIIGKKLTYAIKSCI